MEYEVVIIGAGTCGLYAGAWLGQLGIRTLIVEENDDIQQGLTPCTELLDDVCCDLQRVGIGGFLRLGALRKKKFAVFKSWSSDSREDVVYETSAYEEGAFMWPSSAHVSPSRLNDALMARLCCDCASVDVRFHYDLVDVLEDENDQVVLTLSAGIEEARKVVRAKFVLITSENSLKRFAGIFHMSLLQDQSLQHAASSKNHYTKDKIQRLFFQLEVVPKFIEERDPFETDAVKFGRVKRTSYVDTSEARAVSFTALPDGSARIGYYAQADESYATASKSEAINAILYSRFGYKIGENVQLKKFGQLWQKKRIEANLRPGKRCFLVGPAAQQLAAGVDHHSLSLGLRQTTNLCWKLAAAIRDDAPFSALAHSYHAEMQPHALQVASYVAEATSLAFTENTCRKCFRDHFLSAIIQARHKDHVRPGQPHPITKLPISLSSSDCLFFPHREKNAQAHSYIFSRLFHSPAVATIFPQPKLIELGAKTNLPPPDDNDVLNTADYQQKNNILHFKGTRLLYDTISLNAFVFIGFDADPRHSISPGRLEVLRLIDTAFLYIRMHSVNDHDQEETKDEQHSLYTVFQEESNILPEWRKQYGRPHFIVLRPDKYIFAAIQYAFQLNDLVDELLFLLGIKSSLASGPSNSSKPPPHPQPPEDDHPPPSSASSEDIQDVFSSSSSNDGLSASPAADSCCLL